MIERGDQVEEALVRRVAAVDLDLDAGVVGKRRAAIGQRPGRLVGLEQLTAGGVSWVKALTGAPALLGAAAPRAGLAAPPSRMG